jgi:hypothetical protein
MPNEISLAEFIQQARRGGMASQLFGPEYLMKQTYFTVDTNTNIFTATFGRKVWSALNEQKRFFNALPKVVWGNTVGWRIRTDRGASRSRPITETGTLPTIDVSDVQVVSSLPRIVATDFGVAVKAIFTAGLEGGAGDVLAMEMEFAQLDHIKEVNQELLAGGAYVLSAGGASSFTVPASVAFHFKIGDTVNWYDESASTHRASTTAVVTAVNTGSGVVTVATGTLTVGGQDPTNNDAVYVTARAGFSSIDDIIAQDEMVIASPGNDALGRQTVYNIAAGGRTAGTWNAGALVSSGSGTARDLSLNLLDNTIRNIRVNGGEPKLILLGHDQYYRLERILNTQQRYFGQEEYQVGVGSEKTFPGTRTGLVVATYQGIPILPDADVPHSVSDTDVVLGSNVYVLDTDYLEVAIAQPTQFIENRDYFAANALVVRGLFYTMGELRCYGFNRQAKIIHLNE